MAITTKIVKENAGNGVIAVYKVTSGGRGSQKELQHYEYTGESGKVYTADSGKYTKRQGRGGATFDTQAFKDDTDLSELKIRNANELNAANAAAELERKKWQEEEQATRTEFERQQQEEALKLEETKQQNATAAQERAAAREAAAKAKAADQANQRQISGGTVLGKMLRVSAVRDGGAIDAGATKPLAAGDAEMVGDQKEKMYDSPEEQKRKIKQTFLEKLLSGNAK